MTWWLLNFEQGSSTWFFQKIQHHNESCGREAKGTDPHQPQEMATQALQAYHRHYLCRPSSQHSYLVKFSFTQNLDDFKMVSVAEQAVYALPCHDLFDTVKIFSQV